MLMRLRRPASLALGALLAVAACHRSPVAGIAASGGRDAGPDVGASSAAGDAGQDQGSARDASASDAGADSGGGGGVCPAGVAPVDSCGCGCCGPVAGQVVCYYPLLGQSRDALVEPPPPPSQCANVGCALGVHHICCADPGPDPAADGYCGADISVEDLPRFTITRYDGATCTTLELSSGIGANSQLAISAPPGWNITSATRGTCGAPQDAYAVGGLGSVVLPGATTFAPLYDVHVVLFFDDGTGTAVPVRLDVDRIAVLNGQTCDGGPGGGADGGGASDGGDAGDAGDAGNAGDAGCPPPIPIKPGTCNFCSCTSMGVMVCSERACPTGDAGLQ
jgi:hypothetical protein